jgi:hypothetical protein
MKLNLLAIAAAALLAGTVTASAQADNPPGSKFQTEKNRAEMGLPEKPSGMDRRHSKARHASKVRHHRKNTVGQRSSRGDNPPGSKFQSEKNNADIGLPEKRSPGTRQ